MSDPLGDLGGNVRSPSIARWKVRGPRSTSYSSYLNCSLSLTIETSGNLSKSAFFERKGQFERKFQTEVGVAHQPLLVSENKNDCLLCGIKIFAVHCLVLSQSTRVTERQTGGRTEMKAKTASFKAYPVNSDRWS